MLSAKDLLTNHQAASHEQAILQGLLLLQAKQKKREAADLAAGRLVRITFWAGDTRTSGTYPTRVAAFACLVLGASLAKSRGGVRFEITTQGRMNSAHYDSKKAALAAQALICHAKAAHKAIMRRLKTEQLQHARRLAQAPAQ